MAAALLLSGASAHAVLIDFTSAAVWSGANGDNEFTAVDNGVEVTVATDVGSLTFNSGSGEAPGPIDLGGGEFLAGDGDGLGVRYAGDADEVNVSETVTITFGDVYSVVELFLLDLFSGEYAIIQIAGSTIEYLASPANTGSGGFHTVDVSGSGSTLAITFTAPASGTTYGRGDDGDHDFAIAGLRVNPVSVPEPGTLSLLGAGLLGIGLLRRRRASV